jgi:hypothetical protein
VLHFGVCLQHCIVCGLAAHEECASAARLDCKRLSLALKCSNPQMPQTSSKKWNRSIRRKTKRQNPVDKVLGTCAMTHHWVSAASEPLRPTMYEILHLSSSSSNNNLHLNVNAGLFIRFSYLHCSLVDDTSLRHKEGTACPLLLHPTPLSYK